MQIGYGVAGFATVNSQSVCCVSRRAFTVEANEIAVLVACSCLGPTCVLMDDNGKQLDRYATTRGTVGAERRTDSRTSSRGDTIKVREGFDRPLWSNEQINLPLR